MKRMWLRLACAVLATSGTLWGMTAGDVVEKTGIAGGLCSFPRFVPADESLAIDLARRPTMVVHVLSSRPQVLARIREAAQAEGLLGRSLYAEQGPAASLPFADRLVDVLVVSDLGDADLTPELRSAWLRAWPRGAAPPWWAAARRRAAAFRSPP